MPRCLLEIYFSLILLDPVLLKPEKKGSRGKYVLLYQSYTYRKCAKSKKGCTWKCTSSKTENCEAMVVTDDGLNVISTKNSHTHVRNAEGGRLVEAMFDPRSVSYLAQRISIAIQRGNAARALRTLPPSDVLVSVVTAIDGATLLMLNGYAFVDPSPMPNGERWYCSGRARWSCNVCLHVNDDYELVCISNEHTHSPPLYEKTAGQVPKYSFVPSSQGKHYVLLVEGSKFNQTTSNGRYWNCSKRISSRCTARVRFDSHLNMTFYDGRHNHCRGSPTLPAAVLPAYNVSAAITQAFSRLAREEPHHSSLPSAQFREVPAYSRLSDESQSPVHTLSAQNLSTRSPKNTRFDSESYVIHGK